MLRALFLSSVLLAGCSGKDNTDDSSPGGGDDTGPTGGGGGKTAVSADTFMEAEPGFVDALEPVHALGGVLAELMGVDEVHDLIKGDLQKSPPPPIGDQSCVDVTSNPPNEVIVDYADCNDDRGGSVTFTGSGPTLVTLNGTTVAGYSLQGTLSFTDSGKIGFEYVITDAAGKNNDAVTVTRPKGGTADVSGFGRLLSERDEKFDVAWYADAIVDDSDTTYNFVVGGGGSYLSLAPPSPLVWELEEKKGRWPVSGTIELTVDAATYTANVTAETLQKEVGVDPEVVPLAGIMDLDVTIDEAPNIQLSYIKDSAIPGVQVELDEYTGTISTEQMVEKALECVLREEECQQLADEIDAALADEVTVSIGWSTIAGGVGEALEDNFDPALAYVKK